jgi:hypothetical protein
MLKDRRLRALPGPPHRPIEKPASYGEYFRPGITWSRRSQRGLSLRALPKGCVFSDRGPPAFLQDDTALSLAALLAFSNSAAFRGIVALQMAFGSFEVGVIQNTPVPTLTSEMEESLARCAKAAWAEKRILDAAQSISHAFVLPGLLTVGGKTLADRAAEWVSTVRRVEDRYLRLESYLDEQPPRRKEGA